ncbi:unnamed protein product [Brassicogethes aeneus]|uniref:Uncharacterized protein n=1 Tax=Brassicogethes aeneus TaxID=1431903 RepID=A0A9P0FHH2_BRAAE|nr:unnamed protein product [Brassicogethes aeneus]
MMKNNGFQSKSDFFFFNRWVLKVAGLWSPDSKNRRIQIIYKMYSIFVFISVYCFYVISEFIALLYTYKNLNDFTKNLGIALTSFMATEKIIFWHVNKNKIQVIVKRLEEDQFKYDECEEFHPKNIFFDYKVSGLKITVSFLVFGYLTLFFAFSGPIVVTVVNIIKTNSSEDFLQPNFLPYYSWTPYKYDTPKMYLVALILQGFSKFSTVQSIVGLDCLIINIMNFIACHFALIQQAFLKITERKLNKKIYSQNLTPSEHQIMEKEMKEMCKHIQKLLE